MFLFRWATAYLFHVFSTTSSQSSHSTLWGVERTTPEASALIYDDLLCAGTALDATGEYIHKKYMSCLPLRRQLLKILDIKGFFLIAILRYLFKVFKVPRATILGQYCFKSRWSFPYPHLQLGSEIWIYDPFYKISTSLILYLNIFFCDVVGSYINTENKQEERFLWNVSFLTIMTDETGTFQAFMLGPGELYKVNINSCHLCNKVLRSSTILLSSAGYDSILQITLDFLTTHKTFAVDQLLLTWSHSGRVSCI